MNVDRADLLLKFILAAAGQEERDERELGSIHLLKYAYLGDLAYAESHSGETFTGAPWRFYNFGPWSEELFARIEPAAESVGAEARRFSSAYSERDALRYSLADDGEYERLDAEIPAEIGRTLRSAIRRFHADTSALLHYVYATPPMLRAAPGEFLDFSKEHEESDEHATFLAAPSDAPSAAFAPENPSVPAPLSKTARRKKLEALKKRVHERLAAKRAVTPPPPPRYDDVFTEGVKWLDSLAGSDLETDSGEMIFSSDIWKSRGRREPGVP
jgi:hypothetical protein